MKIYSQTAELRAIKTITAKSSKKAIEGYISKDSLDAGSFLLASLDGSYFHYEPCKLAFERVLFLVKKRSLIITFQDLIEDLSLNEEYRDILREFTKKGVTDMRDAKSLLTTLEKYRRARILYFSAKDILDKLKSPEVDIDKLLDSTSNRITEARTHTTETDPIHIIGKDGNAEDLLDKALSKESDLLLKTGFLEFDERNGGFPSDGVILLAGTTSGGKSALRMNLLANMYKINKIDVVTVSFEMTAEKETRRFLSKIASVPLWKFNKLALTDEDEEKCRVAFKKFHKYGTKHGCRYGTLSPTRGMNIEQTLMLLKPYGFKVIAIDYVSLLEGVDDDNQARILKAIARTCKMFSAENKCLIVLLAQLDTEDNRIRYSKGMLEDMDGAWVWNYTNPEDKDRKRLPIKQRKARDQELFDFELEENFGMMQVLNPEEVVEAMKNKTYGKKNGNNTDAAEESGPLGDSSNEYVVD
jgi:replicative DNA helicase